MTEKKLKLKFAKDDRVRSRITGKLGIVRSMYGTSPRVEWDDEPVPAGSEPKVYLAGDLDKDTGE